MPLLVSGTALAVAEVAKLEGTAGQARDAAADRALAARAASTAAATGARAPSMTDGPAAAGPGVTARAADSARARMTASARATAAGRARMTASARAATASSARVTASACAAPTARRARMTASARAATASTPGSPRCAAAAGDTGATAARLARRARLAAGSTSPAGPGRRSAVRSTREAHHRDRGDQKPISCSDHGVPPNERKPAHSIHPRLLFVSMEMAYRDRWETEIAQMRRLLAGFPMKEECKWGKPTYTLNGKNVVILQGFKEYFALGFFQGALLKDPKKLLVQLGQVQAGRVMKFTSVKEITAKAATIKAYVREAMAVEKAGLRVETRKTSDFPVPAELTDWFRKDPRFKRAFQALTPGRQRGYLYHFAAAKQSVTRAARVEKAMPAIFAGRGFLERR